jgi:hypothetical protein
MRALCAAHIPILLVIIAFAAASPTALRGVDPALQHHYQSGGTTFACIDGTKTIPRGHVNDGYCDCYDGTDEPGIPPQHIITAYYNCVLFCFILRFPADRFRFRLVSFWDRHRRLWQRQILLQKFGI